jgi:hypothetical protein
MNDEEILKDSQKLTDELGDYIEKHSPKSTHDPENNEYIGR